MTSKYQEIPCDKEKLIIPSEITVRNQKGEVKTVKYSDLKLTIQSGQLCFTIPDTEEFFSICRLSTLENILEKGQENAHN